MAIVSLSCFFACSSLFSFAVVRVEVDDADDDDDEAAVTAEAATHESGGDDFSVSTAAV